LDDKAFANISNHSAWLRSSHLARQLAYYELFKQTIDTPGSIIEFGTWRGSNYFFLGRLIDIFCNDAHETVKLTTKKLYGFDTFKGLAGISDKDQSSNTAHDQRKNGGLSFDINIFQEAQIHFRKDCAQAWRANTISGNVLDTWPTFLAENTGLKISMLILDMDIYAPTKCILDTVYPYLSKGACIVFDDYGYEEWPGATKAADEFIDRYSLRLQRFNWSYGPGAYTFLQ